MSFIIGDFHPCGQKSSTVSKKYCLLNSLHNKLLAVSQLHIPVVHLILNDKEVIVMKCIRNCTFLFSINTRSSTKLSKKLIMKVILYRLPKKIHMI
jgi:hypothetical protein